MLRFSLSASCLLCFLIYSTFTSTSLSAQDIRFTQFYASPLTLNPAMTGLMDGKFRVGAIYRDQWRSVLEQPYTTFSAAFDVKFDLSLHKRNKDFVGVGLMFYNDKVNSIDFITNQLALSGAYHKSLTQDNTQYLSLGIQAALSQRSLNYENIFFGDQFNGIDGYTRATDEILPQNNFGFSDYAVGLSYLISPKRNTSFMAAGSIHHFLKPQFSFYKRSDTEVYANITDNRLNIKYSAQFSAQFPIAQQVSLLPRLLFAVQGNHTDVNVGSNIKFALSNTSSTSLQLGTWLRPALNGFNSVSLDALVLLLGIEYQSLLIGMSYEANLRSLSQSRNTQGAFEISLTYMGEYDSEVIMCPTF
ncbi:MAG: PorP/SprF family type IX secretion system membrane protein [Saprospiraceae bacterium]|nr:PorP/SprF family type IX secretion system membrane protein [Saprospiraceae bacterium]